MFENIIISGKILLKSGLHIGGSEQGIKIGGIDNAVIRNPISNLPYIPGSSLKGKMRFLLEHYLNKVSSTDDGKIPGIRTKDGINKIAILFGHLNHDREETKPTRVVFRDAQIHGAVRNFMAENPLDFQLISIEEAINRMNSSFSESKTEVVIDRLTGSARKGGLRTIERVPAGAVFEFEIVLRLFEEEDREFTQLLLQGLKLLQNDALGGSGSRGSGRIQFFDVEMDNNSIELSTIDLKEAV